MQSLPIHVIFCHRPTTRMTTQPRKLHPNPLTVTIIVTCTMLIDLEHEVWIDYTQVQAQHFKTCRQTKRENQKQTLKTSTIFICTKFNRCICFFYVKGILMHCCAYSNIFYESQRVKIISHTVSIYIYSFYAPLLVVSSNC